jgi:hypothetical protein
MVLAMHFVSMMSAVLRMEYTIPCNATIQFAISIGVTVVIANFGACLDCRGGSTKKEQGNQEGGPTGVRMVAAAATPKTPDRTPTVELPTDT